MVIHLSGMGLVGSACACAFSKAGIQFTWSDTNERYTAWRASTGAVYPADGDGRTAEGYRGWEQWAAGADGNESICDLVEIADYWYCTKNPPHGLKGAPGAVAGPLKMYARPSFHLNVQEFVLRTRERFLGQRTDGVASGEMLVVSRGFSHRTARYVWGWTLPVRIDVRRLPESTRRSAVYLREGRFVMAYAYPMPSTDFWYAGSTLLPQGRPREREFVGVDVQRWKKNWDRLSDGQLPIVDELDVIQGWRPSTGSVSQEDQQAMWEERDGALVVMPMWHSGVRWLPVMLRELFGRIGERKEESDGEPVHI